MGVFPSMVCVFTSVYALWGFVIWNVTPSIEDPLRSWIAISSGALAGASTILGLAYLNHRDKLKQWYALEKACLADPGFQSLADSVLTSLATKTQTASESLIQIQRGGLEAHTGAPIEDSAISRFNEIKTGLELEFRLAQGAFYDLYDLFVWFKGRYFSVELRDRNWKSYLDATEDAKVA
jgi:hypothetical protein